MDARLRRASIAPVRNSTTEELNVGVASPDKADKLRDGLSFLIPTSAIEVFPLEHYVQKMEHGAKIHPHLYPLK